MKKPTDGAKCTGIGCAVAVLLLAVLAVTLRSTSVKVLGGLAFLSAAAAMPVDAAQEIFSFDGMTPDVSETEMSSAQIKPDNQTVAADTHTASSNINEETASSQSVDLQKSLTVTPEDITKLIKEYEAKASSDKADGSIVEKDYHTSGCTHRYDNVYVKNVNETDISIKDKLNEKARLEIPDHEQPIVLIVHSHTTEAYQILDRDFYAVGYTTRSNSSQTNISRVGREIKLALESEGFSTIHDETIFDTTYSGSYPNSRKAINAWLKKYPTIQVVLDVHRDAMQSSDGVKIKPVAAIEGKKAAQIMIISGCMEKGNGVENFPDWEDNLTFAVQLQKQLEDMYPGLTRPLYFSPRKYNMDITPCSLLVEIGSDANTLEQAAFSGRMLGHSLAKLLERYISEK